MGESGKDGWLVVWGLMEWFTTYVGRGGTRREDRGWMRGRKGCTGTGTLVQVWMEDGIDIFNSTCISYKTYYSTGRK